MGADAAIEAAVQLTPLIIAVLVVLLSKQVDRRSIRPAEPQRGCAGDDPIEGNRHGYEVPTGGASACAPVEPGGPAAESVPTYTPADCSSPGGGSSPDRGAGPHAANAWIG